MAPTNSVDPVEELAFIQACLTGAQIALAWPGLKNSDSGRWYALPEATTHRLQYYLNVLSSKEHARYDKLQLEFLTGSRGIRQFCMSMSAPVANTMVNIMGDLCRTMGRATATISFKQTPILATPASDAVHAYRRVATYLLALDELLTSLAMRSAAIHFLLFMVTRCVNVPGIIKQHAEDLADPYTSSPLTSHTTLAYVITFASSSSSAPVLRPELEKAAARGSDFASALGQACDAMGNEQSSWEELATVYNSCQSIARDKVNAVFSQLRALLRHLANKQPVPTAIQYRSLRQPALPVFELEVEMGRAQITLCHYAEEFSCLGKGCHLAENTINLLTSLDTSLGVDVQQRHLALVAATGAHQTAKGLADLTTLTKAGFNMVVDRQDIMNDTVNKATMAICDGQAKTHEKVMDAAQSIVDLQQQVQQLVQIVGRLMPEDTEKGNQPLQQQQMQQDGDAMCE